MMKINRTAKGALCLILSAFFFALMGLFVQLSGDLPSFQKSFFRNAVAALVALVILIKEGGGFKWQKDCLLPLVLSAVFGTVGVLCNFYALDHMILSDALMLNKLSPFFAVILSYFVLKEKINLFQISMVILAFFGSLFIIKPTPELLNPASIFGFIGGLGAGAAYTMVRKLTGMGERKTYIVFFFSAFSCVCLLPYLLFNYVSMSTFQTLYLILAGICAALGQFSITAAYSYAPAREISVYDYTQIIFSTLMSLIVFGTLPDVLSIIGYVIICSATVIMFLRNKRIK